MKASTDGPIVGGVAITANNSNTFSTITRAVYVGTGGDLNVQFPGSNGSVSNVVFKNMNGGQIYPLRVNVIFATSTTANNLIILY